MPVRYLARLPRIISGLTIDTSGGRRVVSSRETFRNGASPTLPIHDCGFDARSRDARGIVPRERIEISRYSIRPIVVAAGFVDLCY